MIIKFKGEDARGLKMAMNLILIIESIHAKNLCNCLFRDCIKVNVCFSQLRCLLYLDNISYFTQNKSRARMSER